MALRGLQINTKQRDVGKTKISQTNFLKDQSNNKFLNDLPESVRQNLFSVIETVYLESGEYVYQPDDKLGYLYFPESAVISEFQILEDGKTIEVAITGPEGVTGMTSVFSSQPVINWSQTLIAGKARRINLKFFRREIAVSSNFQEILFDYINSYIAQISKKVACCNFHPLEKRLCGWFLTLHDHYGGNLPLTQEQIARSLGVHRPSITLITQLLREQGIIDYRRGKLLILDRRGLEFSACECYSVAQKPPLNCHPANSSSSLLRLY